MWNIKLKIGHYIFYSINQKWYLNSVLPLLYEERPEHCLKHRITILELQQQCLIFCFHYFQLLEIKDTPGILIHSVLLLFFNIYFSFLNNWTNLINAASLNYLHTLAFQMRQKSYEGQDHFVFLESVTLKGGRWRWDMHLLEKETKISDTERDWTIIIDHF